MRWWPRTDTRRVPWLRGSFHKSLIFLLCPYVNLLLKAPERFPNFFFPAGKPLRSAHCCAATRPVEGLTSVCVCTSAAFTVLSRRCRASLCLPLETQLMCSSLRARQSRWMLRPPRSNYQSYSGFLEEGEKVSRMERLLCCKKKRKKRERLTQRFSLCCYVYSRLYIFCFYVLLCSNESLLWILFFQFYWEDFISLSTLRSLRFSSPPLSSPLTISIHSRLWFPLISPPLPPSHSQSGKTSSSKCHMASQYSRFFTDWKCWIPVEKLLL